MQYFCCNFFRYSILSWFYQTDLWREKGKRRWNTWKERIVAQKARIKFHLFGIFVFCIFCLYFCICHCALLYSVESVQCPKKAKIKFHLSRQRESLEINPLKYLSCSNISHFTIISHIQTSYSSRFFSCLNILAQSCQLKNLHDISHSFTEVLLKKHT